MKSYLVIKKLHSDKKNVDYLSSVLVIGDRQYFVNLPFEAIALILNKSLRDVASLPVGFVSDEFTLDIGE